MEKLVEAKGYLIS